MHKIMSDYYDFQELSTIQYWDIKCYMCMKDYTFINIDASQSYLTVASSIWHSATSEYLNTSIFISILFVLLLKSLSKAFKGSFLSPHPPPAFQDCKRLPDVSWSPSHLAAEHGREAQQQEVLHRGSNVPGSRCCPGGRVSKHAGGSQVPSCWQCHLSGRKHWYYYTCQTAKGR